MSLFLKPISISLLSLSLFILSKSQEIYTPYSDYKHPTINSVYGTGNRTLDVLYRKKCATLCNKETYSDEHCCEGNTLEDLKCQSFRRCQEILDNFQLYVLNIAFISYFSLLAITMVVVFIVYYHYTRDKKYKCKNACSSSVIVFCAGTVIPIIVIQFYCWYKAISIEAFFGASFSTCVNVDTLLQSVDVKNDERPNRNDKSEENYGYNKNYRVDNNIDNAKSVKSSTGRSNKYMMEEKYNYYKDKVK